jgi:Flp pilus assembly pilin Flp
MQKLLSAFWSEENGQDMVEYSLLLGFIAVSGFGVLTEIRTEMVSTWQAISAGFANALS